jgi:cytochrome c-type biogenesis protein CcmH
MNGIFLLLALVGAAPTYAADPPAAAPAAAPQGLPREFGDPGAPPPAAGVEELTREIGSRMRCPVCQAMSVTDSPSESAVTMKGRIQELVALGYSEQQIRAYFVSRYGEWVLLDPPMEGANLLLWATPGVLLVGGVALLLLSARRPKPATGTGAKPETEAATTTDPRRQALLAELED